MSPTPPIDSVIPADVHAEIMRRLARAGRATASPETLVRADEMLATDPLPWCWVRF